MRCECGHPTTRTPRVLLIARSKGQIIGDGYRFLASLVTLLHTALHDREVLPQPYTDRCLAAGTHLRIMGNGSRLVSFRFSVIYFLWEDTPVYFALETSKENDLVISLFILTPTLVKIRHLGTRVPKLAGHFYSRSVDLPSLLIPLCASSHNQSSPSRV
jgi:hypothetical protein